MATYGSRVFFSIGNDGAVYLSDPTKKTYEVVGRGKTLAAQESVMKSYINHKFSASDLPSITHFR